MIKKESVPPGESSELFILCYRPLDTSSQDTKYSGTLTIKKVTHIINRGSTKPNLQTLAEEIVNLCNHHRVSVIPIWVPRDNNHFTDYLSKLTDVNDWGIHSDIYQWLNTLWGPFTVDRFTTWYNTKRSLSLRRKSRVEGTMSKVTIFFFIFF